MALQIGELIRRAGEDVPRHVAATKTPRQLTFAEVESSTAQLVRALAARDVAYGDRVVWWGETTLDAIALWFALARLGAVIVPMNPGATPEESKTLLDLADPALIVGDEAHAGDVSLGCAPRRLRAHRHQRARDRRERPACHLLHQRVVGPAQGCGIVAPRLACCG